MARLEQSQLRRCDAATVIVWPRRFLARTTTARFLRRRGIGRDVTGALGPGQSLAADTSQITNPRTRQLVDGVIARLDQSFDSMLSRVVDGGVYVALAEFVGQHGDGAAMVRALHDAGLLAICDATAARRRVTSEELEGVQVMGVVLRASALQGYAEWMRRWHPGVASERHGG